MRCCYYAILGRRSFVVGSWCYSCCCWILLINSVLCRCTSNYSTWSSYISSCGMKRRIEHHRRCSAKIYVRYLHLRSTFNFYPRLLFLFLFYGKFKCSCSVLLSFIKDIANWKIIILLTKDLGNYLQIYSIIRNDFSRTWLLQVLIFSVIVFNRRICECGCKWCCVCRVIVHTVWDTRI